LEAKNKATRLFIAGVLLIFLGTVLDLVALPSVKRIWTPTWAIQSGGWVILMLTGFYSLVEIAGWRRLVFPLVVVGMIAGMAYGNRIPVLPALAKKLPGSSQL
jgi:predicted acyltransferase